MTSGKRVLIQTIGLQRSGNHAIINWLCSLFRRPAHLNDLEHDHLLRPSDVEAIGAMAQNDCIVCSFEDSGNRLPEGRRLLDSVGIARAEDFPGDLRVAVLYILRDPYNCWASRARAHDAYGLTSSPRIEDFIGDWKEFAGLYEARPESFVCYNQWFRSEAYRREICARLGGVYSEATLGDVPRAGGGSSFDGYVRPSYREILGGAGKYLNPEFLGRFLRDPGDYLRRLSSPRPNGRDLSVEARWEYLLAHDSGGVLLSDEEIRAKSRGIFGFTLDSSGALIQG